MSKLLLMAPTMMYVYIVLIFQATGSGIHTIIQDLAYYAVTSNAMHSF